jgi:hypothetical protein
MFVVEGVEPIVGPSNNLIKLGAIYNESVVFTDRIAPTVEQLTANVILSAARYKCIM